MIGLLKQIIALVLELLPAWRKAQARRKASEVMRAVAEHDREAVNRILEEKRNG